MKAIVIRKTSNDFRADIEDVLLEQTADLEISIQYSSLNYKDALAITNRGSVVRSWPMVAGIDGVGTVVSSSTAGCATGSTVIVTGWGMGEVHWGCLAEKVWIKSDWPTLLPAALSARDAMAVGTAGLTAMLCIMAMERHGLDPHDGPVLVTGAVGGVGSFAVMFLKKLGFHVVASTGRTEESDFLHALGASDILDRKELSEPGKPLQPERWAAVIDCVGSVTLANACASTRYGGVVAACGLAQGMDLPATVAPFILRGVTLAGIDSVRAPQSVRREAWARIARLVDHDMLDQVTREIDIEEVIGASEMLLAGKVRGRLVVRIAP